MLVLSEWCFRPPIDGRRHIFHYIRIKCLPEGIWVHVCVCTNRSSCFDVSLCKQLAPDGPPHVYQASMWPDPGSMALGLCGALADRDLYTQTHDISWSGGHCAGVGDMRRLFLGAGLARVAFRFVRCCFPPEHRSECVGAGVPVSG